MSNRNESERQTYIQAILDATTRANTQEFELTAAEMGVSPQDLADFETFLHEPYPEIISRLRHKAHRIVEQVYSTLRTDQLPTPYYKVDSPLTLLSKEAAVDAVVLHSGSLEILNHPVRHKVRQTVENKPYQPAAQNSLPLFEEARRDRIALAFDDVALDLKPDADPEKARTKRNPLLSNMWTKVGKHARLPWCGSSMPVCTGDPWSVATSAQAGMLVMIPRDAHFADVHNQIKCFQDANVIINHPLFTIDESLDLNEVIAFHKRNIGITIEPNPRKAYERVKLLYQAGCRTFRIYGPEGSTREMADTLQVVKSAYGDEVEVFVGQVIDADQALLLQELKADGLYAGVGGGGICDTPGEASIAYLLPQTLYEFRQAGVSIPYIAEAGVGRNLPVVLALGGSAVSKSNAIYGGTIESPGNFVYMQDEYGLYKPYAGEASSATKQLNGKLDRLGKPMFIEGIAGKTYYSRDFPSVAYRIYTLLESLATALVFARQRTIDGLRSSEHISMWRNTSAGSHTRSTHH